MQMEEPTCLMRSFSQPSGSSRDFNEGDPTRCLGESISFGRYMSEPLEWDKFSAFSSNRYLEEAAMYSKPGSVAKMKAYFEAYYKTIASRKRTANKASDSECTSVVQHSSCLHSDMPLGNRSASENPRNEEDCNLESNSTFTVPSKEMEKSKCAPEVESLKESDHLVKFNSKMKKSLVSNTGTSACSKPPISSEMQQSKKGDDQERQNKKIKKLPDSNSRITSAYCKPSKIPTFSGRVVLSHPSKEGFATPRDKQKAQDTVHKSIKFGPHADVNKNSSRTILKSLTEYPLTPSAKIMKDKSTPLQIPNRASVARKSKHTSATPQPEIGRSQSTPGRSLSRGRARDLELQSPSLNNMKPSRPCGLKARATITFSPFNFRTEERAARRREFFLKQQEKAQELEKPKQDRVNTARKLLNTIGLKVKSATDSNTKSSKQDTRTHPQPRPSKKRDTLRMKIGNENDSPNIL